MCVCVLYISISICIILIYMMSIRTCPYLFLLKFVYCSRFFIFAAPTAMSNTDNYLI